MGEYTTRELRLGDADAAALNQVQTWHDTYKNIMPFETLERITVEILAPKWAAAIKENHLGAKMMGAFDYDRLLGTAMFGIPREKLGYDVELWSMNVPKMNQGQGVGKLLFKTSVKMMRDAGHRSMYLYCIDKNVNALRFYASQGGHIAENTVQRNGYVELLVIWEDLFC